MPPDSQFWTSVGFAAILLAISVLAFAAYWSLRRMDDVVLRARMYMNRKRLFVGFFSLSIGTIAIASVSFLAAAFHGADVAFPGEIYLAGYMTSLVFVGFGCYNFYALSRPPSSPHHPRSEGG